MPKVNALEWAKFHANVMHYSPLSFMGPAYAVLSSDEDDEAILKSQFDPEKKFD